MSLDRFWRTARTQVGATALLAAVVAFSMELSPMLAQAKSQKTFPTAEKAVQALAQAAQAYDLDGLLAIFGSEAEDLLSSGDPVDDRRNREVVLLAYQQGWRLVDQGANTKKLIIGDEGWPFPVPLVKEESGWRFDSEAGAEEVLARRIGRNELRVLELCMTYVQAQMEYASQGHDGKPAGIYARKTASDPGKQNGLYWAVKPGEKPSPLGTQAAQAAADGYADTSSSSGPRPFRGYFFRILTAQGNEAPGGAKSYLVGGEMTAGFALVAYPVEYDDSGVMTFIMNQDGILYEKDLGGKTTENASQIREYNPDATWSKVESSR